MCYSISFVENSMGFASILTIFIITCDRYYVICRPLSVKSVMNQARTFKLISLIWLVSIIINLPLIFFTNYKTAYFYDCTVEYKCYIKVDSSLKHFYIISVYFLNYFLIGIILLLMYTKIFMFLKKSNKFLISCSNESGLNKRECLANTTETSRAIEVIYAGLPDRELINLAQACNTKAKSSFDSKAGNFILFKRDNEGESLIALNINNGKCGKYIKQRKQLIILLGVIIVFFYLGLFPLKIWNLGIV